MSKTEQEVEVKFLVRDLNEIRARLAALKARETSARVFEINLRYDTPDGSLTRARQVLRLRQDSAAVMTFKGPSEPGKDVSIRQEIEFQVSDFSAAQHLLEALGYKISIMYEKYRTTYALASLIVVLDEMPYGMFVEIEGEDAGSIRAAADALGLDWHARITTSYLALFHVLRAARRLTALNLTFEELAGVNATADDLGVPYAA